MRRCLVVEGSGVIRKVAQHFLSDADFEVVEVETGAAALEMCATDMPDAILLSWDLADMSGFDVIVAIKHRFKNTTPHIVYATTENDPADISRALQAGASDYLIVPFVRKDLVAKFQIPAEAA